MNRERNLLFGVLAFQMDFITREALIAAVAAWVPDKSRPLEEILVERGALTAERRKLLSPLVDEHVRAHGDDPGRSLASVSSIGSVLDDLARVADADVAASLGPLSSFATRVGGDHHPSWAPSVGTSSSSGLRFRIVRPHDKGGLGIVSVAQDLELNREVALKEIQGRHADDPEKRSRFVMEAEVTGGLEHPGIVPVYGLGHFEDGRPFYAMRFVRGDSLKQAIARFHQAEGPGRDPGEREVQLRELLGRFLDVCNAIAYAHSRGVLHRDLKPGNVMLGPFGETLVVDWGLAKTLAADAAGESHGTMLRPSSSGGSSATLMGSAVGTPAYMPPEQAEGRHDRLGPASDVYSLGATLYHLLTGKIPFEQSDLGTLFRNVVEGEFPPPRAANPEVHPALEAVCLKAMARDPSGRYQEATALASDIKSWLAGEPVTAYREPWAARAARWARRHKTPVVGAASLLATTLVALIVGLVLVRREQARTQDQRDLARANFLKAREAADGFLTRISEDSQLAQPGLQPLRRRLLEAGLGYYEGFAREGVSPGDFARLADAYARVARINDLVGSKERARADYREAARYFEEASRADPADLAPRRRLASTLNDLGTLELATGRMAEAASSFERARGLSEEILRAREGDRDALKVLADTFANLGEWRNKAGDRVESIGLHRKAIGLYEGLAAAVPDGPAQADLARGLANLGIVQAGARRFAEALLSLGRARDIRQGLVADDPASSEGRNALAVAYHWIAAVHYWDRQLDRALEAYRRSLEIREELVAINTVYQYQDDLARDFDDIGSVHREAGRLDEALKAHEEAREIRARLVRFHPEVPLARNRLAEGLTSIGQALALAGRDAEALRSFEEARGLLDKLVLEHPGEAEYRIQLARVCEHIGNLEGGVVKDDEVLAMYGKAREIREGLLREHPDEPEYLIHLSNSYSNLGSLKASTGHLEEGIDLLRRAKELREKVLASRPGDVETLSHLGAILENLGTSLEDQGQLPRALDALREAVDRQRAALDKAPQAAEVVEFLGIHYESLARVRRAMGRPSEAAATARERLKLRPEDPAFLVQAARELALCVPITPPAEAEGYSREAIDAIRRAIAAGFRDFALLRENPDLAPIRGEALDRLIRESPAGAK